jgi:ABC-type lipoprotein release transport system permease subunit
VGRIARASLARRRASIAVVALAAALLFGGALGALAGARRSSTALDRLLVHSAPEDVFVSAPEDGSLDMRAVDRLPQVLGTAYQSYLAMVPVAGDGRAQTELAGAINPYLWTPKTGPPDAVNRLRVIEGRGFDRSEPLEAVIDEELAAARGLAVGSHFPMATFSVAQLDTVFSNETSGAATPDPDGPVLDLTVVGIARMPVDIHPGEDEHTVSFGGTKELYLTPALYERYGDQIAVFGPPIAGTPEAVRLVHGVADLDAFTAGVRALPGGGGAVIDVSDSDALGSVRTARPAIATETAALLALAALLAASGVALVGHALARLARSATDELGVLRAIGVRPIELLAVTAAPGLLAAALGAVGAVAVALAASPFTPIGLGRQAEVSPGFDLDPPAVLVGGAAVLVVGAALALLTARPTAHHVGAGGHVPRSTGVGLSDRLASAGAPFGPTIGARFATGRQGVERSSPLRSAMAGIAVAIVALVSVATYGASLQRLSGSPAEQGASWDLAIGNINLSDYSPADIANLAADPHIAGVAASAGPEGRATVNGLDVSLAGFDEVSGGVRPRALTGRLPKKPGEVALGRRTAARLHVNVGDHVDLVASNGQTRRVVLVGTALLNPGIAPTMRIGEGAIVTIDQIRELLPDQPVTFLFASVKPGTSIDEVITALERDWGKNVGRPILAPDVVNLRRVRGIPIALALSLAAAAVFLLAFALVLSVGQRRIDIGVLQTIGTTRRQLASALTWQALWLYGGAALVGIPLGVVAGRLVWRQVADGLGVVIGPVVPIGSVALVVLGGLALVAALVVLPARSATRHPPGRVLRTE